MERAPGVVEHGASARLKIAIAGGGIAGLTAALQLHRRGHDVDVYESVVEPTELGVGINLLPHAVRILDALGLLGPLEEHSVKTSQLLFLSSDGTEIWSEPRGRAAGYPWPQLSIHRGRLQMVLLDRVREELGGARVHTGHRLEAVDGVENDASTATAHFIDRRTDHNVDVDADVVVGADGLHSRVRQQLYPHQEYPHPSGLVLWRGATIAPAFRDGATMFMAGDDSQKAVVYPLTPPDDRGLALINWVAEQPRDVDMSTVSWNRPVEVGRIAALFAGWDFDWIDVGSLIGKTEVAYEFPMVDRTPIDRWSFGRVTLIGDAAHPMRPNGSNGASQAILDTEVLRDVFDRESNPTDALQMYESMRLEPTAALTLANRQAGPERVMQWVAERCDGGCEGRHQCVAVDELEREATAYKQLAQFDLATLRALAEQQ